MWQQNYSLSVFVPGLSPFEPRVNCPCAPTLPPFTLQLFLDFCAIFSPEWPLNFFVITIYQVIWPSLGILPWLNQNLEFVVQTKNMRWFWVHGTNQTKGCIRGRKPDAKKLLERWTHQIKVENNWHIQKHGQTSQKNVAEGLSFLVYTLMDPKLSDKLPFTAKNHRFRDYNNFNGASRSVYMN